MNRTIRSLPYLAPLVAALWWFGQWQLAVTATAGVVIAAAVGAAAAERKETRA